MEFYTDCRCYGNDILLRYIKGGKRLQKRVAYQPTLYLIDRNGKESKYHTIFKQPLIAKKFTSIRDARGYVKRFENVAKFTIYGNTNFQYVYLHENYPEHIEYDETQLATFFIDIEVGSANGFPTVEMASEPIVAITIKYRNKFYVFGIKEYECHREDVLYQQFDDEEELLEAFITFWAKVRPDIVTGWYIAAFDIPYLIRRINNLFGEDRSRELSPWGIVQEGGMVSKGKQMLLYDIYGIAVLDYIDLYKKFQPSSQESYSLNNIANVELGEAKLSYEEFGNLHQMYATDYQKFIEYNIRDVELVQLIDDKMKLLSLAITSAYDARVNYQDVFAQTRMWDAITFNHLNRLGIKVPPRKIHNKAEFQGAFVKDPKPAAYNWVVSFDVDSEYPMTMVQWNISPETLIKGEKLADNVGTAPSENEGDSEEDVGGRNLFNEEIILKGNYDRDMLIENNWCLSANGYYFNRNERGFLPTIILKMYEDRLRYKDEYKKAKKAIADIEHEMKKRGMDLTNI